RRLSCGTLLCGRFAVLVRGTGEDDLSPGLLRRLVRSWILLLRLALGGNREWRGGGLRRGEHSPTAGGHSGTARQADGQRLHEPRPFCFFCFDVPGVW